MNNININPMNMRSAKWKQVLKWLALALTSLVVIDWVLDGRMRRKLPGRHRDNVSDVNS